MQQLSIIVPVLNEAPGIVDTLTVLQDLRARGAELIVVDGGSIDATPGLAATLADRVINSTRGRAKQMNAGARLASGDLLLFLHADCLLPPDADKMIVAALAGSANGWGRFDVRIAGSRALLDVIAWFMNRRSCLTGIATGDQGIFVRRDWFADAGGYPEISLMEDVALSRTLRRRGRPFCVPARLTTSGRRWEKKGIARTVLLMWWLRLRFFFGSDPARLAQLYERG